MQLGLHVVIQACKEEREERRGRARGKEIGRREWRGRGRKRKTVCREAPVRKPLTEQDLSQPGQTRRLASEAVPMPFFSNNRTF